MQYEKDLEWTRRLLLAMVAMNVLMAVEYAFRHMMADFVAGLIWTINFLSLLRWNRQCQGERDERRIHEAVLHKLQQEDREV